MLDAHYQAKELMHQGRYEEASRLFERNVAADPHFKDLELLGECFVRLGKLKDAIVPLAAATALNRGVRAPSLLAEVFFQLDHNHDAQAMAELALERDPKNRRALEIHKKLTQAITL